MRLFTALYEKFLSIILNHLNQTSKRGGHQFAFPLLGFIFSISYVKFLLDFHNDFLNSPGTDSFRIYKFREINSILRSLEEKNKDIFFMIQLYLLKALKTSQIYINRLLNFKFSEFELEYLSVLLPSNSDNKKDYLSLEIFDRENIQTLKELYKITGALFETGGLRKVSLQETTKYFKGLTPEKNIVSTRILLNIMTNRLMFRENKGKQDLDCLKELHNELSQCINPQSLALFQLYLSNFSSETRSWLSVTREILEKREANLFYSFLYLFT